ncbi:MAG TPA: ABC transporter permease subunit [Candidatus Lokiarchaeia archaeon]|nr:ABC transporter permease subunit [Candidatus Lokiarchaeia archaeon]
MNFRYLMSIAKKDWVEIRNNKQFLAPLIILPILLAVVLPLAFSLAIPGTTQVNMTAADLASLRLSLHLGSDVPAGTVVFLLLVNDELKPFLLLVPTMFCMVIASDSIAGEKERKTIESFLVLPLTDREIIVGKVLGSLIPALGASWLSFAAMGLTINITAGPMLGGQMVVFNDATWWLMMILLVPTISFMSTLFMVLISSIATNARTAQQYSIIVILPIIALIISGISNVSILDVGGELIFASIVILVTIFLAYLTTKNLNREKLVVNLD